VTQPGEIIELGAHRMMCGDASKAEDVQRPMNGACAHLLFTDPPQRALLAALCHLIHHVIR